ncbi:hypothetical protein ACSBR2_017910 [Camellia fascicularis]
MMSSSGSGLLLNEFNGYEDDDVAEKSSCGRYVRYNEVLDRGLRNSVYMGFDLVDGMEVTWNKVSVDDSFQSEERVHGLNTLLKPLKHRNIIKSCSSWVDHQTKTINMISESFTSGSLRQFRQKHRNVDIIAIKNWARQILQAPTMELLKDPFFEITAFTTCVNDTPDLVSVLEFKISNKKSELRLRGERADGNSISLTLRIADKCSGQR